MSKKYGVTFTFSHTGYYDAEVEANGIEDAKRIAREIGDDPDKFIDYILEMDSNCLWEPVDVDDIEVWEPEQDSEPKKNNKEDTMKKYSIGDTIDCNDTDVCPICGGDETECDDLAFENGEVRATMSCLCCNARYDLWLRPTNAIVVDLGE